MVLTDQRNRDLLIAHESLSRSISAFRMKRADIYQLLSETQAPCFYVKEGTASRYIRARLFGASPGVSFNRKLPMYEEIYRRYVARYGSFWGRQSALYVEEILSEKAPSFYLTPESIKVILSNHVRRNRRRK